MKRKLFPVAILTLALALALAPSASAQFPAQTQTQTTLVPKVSGYLFLDFSQGQDDSPFSNGRVGGLGAGFFLTGQLSSQFTYNLEARYSTESQVEVDQAWIAFAASPSIQITAGEFFVPFGKYNEASRPHETLYINVPLVFEFAYPQRWRELGLEGQANWSWLTVKAYAGNGLAEAATVADAQQFGDNNANKAWGGRLGLKPDQTLDLGVSYYQGKYDSLDQRWLRILGADLSWVTQDYQVLGEYVRTRNDNPSPSAQGVVEGFYALVAINYQNFFPMVSFQKVKDTDPFHGAGWAAPDTPGEGIALNKTRWAIGLVYQPVNIVRLKAEYDFNKDSGLTLKENVFSLQVAASF